MKGQGDFRLFSALLEDPSTHWEADQVPGKISSQSHNIPVIVVTIGQKMDN